ncbi:hypothetical protein MKW98_017109 [Papaver atlanticum]|uniref:Plantacyanin n=1 Tax=Papaver atlanticum TaxID=357466 RepID=A0AAD4TKE1_9MAGN|nr:hypothetical protein MKW98_017109 [Papaver atlanticum]
MAMGRGSAATVSVLILCLLVLQTQMVQSVTYTVGGAGGWTFNTAKWPAGKRFRAGDVLVFNYSPQAHNVVRVNALGYKSCKTPKGAQVFRSGKDQIKLQKGPNYFICNFVGHCESNMKISVNAM